MVKTKNMKSMMRIMRAMRKIKRVRFKRVKKYQAIWIGTLAFRMSVKMIKVSSNVIQEHQ